MKFSNATSKETSTPSTVWKERQVPHQSSTSPPSFHQPDIRSSDIPHLRAGTRSLCAPQRTNFAEKKAQNETSSEVPLNCLYANYLRLPNKLPENAVVFERRVTSQTTNSPTRNILNPSQNKRYQCCFNSCTIIRFMKNITEFTNLNSIRP